MRALVTGITGFVGCHLVEHLAAAGDQIVGISASGRWPAALAHLTSLARVETLDLADADCHSALTDLLVKTRPEAIYHLAAQANPQSSVTDPRGTWALNLGGTLNLLEAVRASGSASKTEYRPKVIVVGSGVSYGNPAPEFLPVDELCPLRPNNPYAASKAAADMLGIQYALGHGCDVVIARPFNHAGPRQVPSYVLASLAQQVAEVEAGLKPRVEVGNLDVTRDFTDVRDIVRAYRLLALKGVLGEVYNIGTGRRAKLAEMLATLQSLTLGPVTVHVDPARVRPVDQPLLLANPAKLQAATGWEPSFTIEQTLADMLTAARATINRENPVNATGA